MLLLVSSKFYMSIISTIYKIIRPYKSDNRVLLDLDYEGLKEGRTSMAAQYELLNLNESTFINSVKIENTKELSSIIVDFQKSKGKIMHHLQSQDMLRKYNVVLGRKDSIELVRVGE